MLYKIKYYYNGTGYYDRHFRSVYRSAVYAEYFIKLDTWYMRYYYKKARVFNKRYVRYKNKKSVNNQKRLKNIWSQIKRKNRGSKIKSYFFKKKIKKKRIVKDKRKKKFKSIKFSKKKKFKYKRYI